MSSRSLSILSISLGCLLFAGCAQQSSASRDQVTTKAMQQAMQPAAVLADLKAGNERFVRGQSTPQNWLSQAASTARDGQYPKAIVLSCLDSRVPPEVVFDQAIGDIFVGRVAGNFENVDLLGSMEFGTKLAGSRLIVVLGHNACGAVKGAIADAKLGNLTATLDNIKPAVAAAHTAMPGAGKDDPAFVQRVAEENVRITVADIQKRSPTIQELVAKGELMVVGAWYDLATGKVHWLDS
ncbi:MAG: carbonic anhydrase [Planctomycetes bacterium]|nr:carbonic anhydrase [Planctomycetota bacterium]